MAIRFIPATRRRGLPTLIWVMAGRGRGHTVTEYGVGVRIFGRMRPKSLSISAVRITSGNPAEKANAVIAYNDGAAPDFHPFLLQRLKNTGPFPEAGDRMEGGELRWESARIERQWNNAD